MLSRNIESPWNGAFFMEKKMENKQINVNVGETINVMTTDMANLGYITKLDFNPEKIQQIQKIQTYQSYDNEAYKDMLIGGAPQKTLEFKALRKGTLILTVTHYRPFNPIEEMIEKYQITIL